MQGRDIWHRDSPVTGSGTLSWSGKLHGQMYDLRLSFGAGPEAEFAEHFQHRSILGQDLGDQFLQPCVARQASQMTHEGRSDALSLIRIDHDEGYFGLARPDNDVAPTTHD